MTEQKTKAAAEPPLDCRVGRCAKHCDFERAKLVSRATWVCPDCGRDISIEYLYWAPVAHPEWFDRDLDGTTVPNMEFSGRGEAQQQVEPAVPRSDGMEG